MSHIRRWVSGPCFSTDLSRGLAAWAQGKLTTSAAEGFERKNKKMHPWRFAASNFSKTTELGLGLLLHLGLLKLLWLIPAWAMLLSYCACALVILISCPSWSIALLCYHKHPWWWGLRAPHPSPAPSPGKVGQALAGKVLPITAALCMRVHLWGTYRMIAVFVIFQRSF